MVYLFTLTKLPFNRFDSIKTNIIKTSGETKKYIVKT